MDRNDMQILDLQQSQQQIIEQVANLLVRGFATAWSDMGTALAGVRESLEEGHISRVALGQQGRVLGWIAGFSTYSGRVWELHPLVVDAKFQGQGIGHALVLDFEERVRERGALTVVLGTDDEEGRTSLSGVNLLPNVYQHIERIQNFNLSNPEKAIRAVKMEPVSYFCLQGAQVSIDAIQRDKLLMCPLFADPVLG